MSYKIGSFNLRNFGKTAFSKSSSRDLRLIAKIIKEEKFDIVALQEILSEGAAINKYDKEHTKKSLLMELGPNWDCAISEKANNNSSDNRGENYAFVWNKKKLKLSSCILPDGTERINQPQVIDRKQANNAMSRKPFYGRFTSKGIPGAPFVELRLICVHTSFGNDTEIDRRIRENEIDLLVNSIYPSIEDKSYGNHLPSYTILLGDYNAVISDTFESIDGGKMPMKMKSEEFIFPRGLGGREKQIVTVQSEKTTLGKNPNIEQHKGSEKYNTYVNDYDHFTFDKKQFEGIDVDVCRIDAVNKYCHKRFDDYYDKVSDHVPIAMEMELVSKRLRHS